MDTPTSSTVTLPPQLAGERARQAIRTLEKARNDAATKIEIGIREAYAKRREKIHPLLRWLHPKIAPAKIVRKSSVNALGMNLNGYLQFHFDQEIEALARFADRCRSEKDPVAIPPELQPSLETHGGLSIPSRP